MSLLEISSKNIAKYLAYLIIPYLLGYTILKHIKIAPYLYEYCIDNLLHGINISNEISEIILHNITYLQERGIIDLNCPCENTVVLAGMIFEVFEKVLESKNIIEII